MKFGRPTGQPQGKKKSQMRIMVGFLAPVMQEIAGDQFLLWRPNHMYNLSAVWILEVDQVCGRTMF